MHNLMPRLLQVETAVASSEGRNREWTEDQRSKPVEASSYIHIRSFRTRTLDRAVRQGLQRDTLRPRSPLVNARLRHEE
jgi:hypothetical protein